MDKCASVSRAPAQDGIVAYRDLHASGLVQHRHLRYGTTEQRNPSTTMSVMIRCRCDSLCASRPRRSTFTVTPGNRRGAAYSARSYGATAGRSRYEARDDELANISAWSDKSDEEMNITHEGRDHAAYLRSRRRQHAALCCAVWRACTTRSTLDVASIHAGT